MIFGIGILSLSHPAIRAEDPFLSPTGSLSCSATACHGRRLASIDAGYSAGTEFAYFRRHDPHARSAETIDSERFQQILDNLGALRDGKFDSAVYLRCAGCHDPQSPPDNNGSITPGSSSASSARFVAMGIGCESCHGNSQRWLNEHYSRAQTRESLSELGFVRTDDIAIRARQCAKCHVGSSENDMNHDMIAAGHPELVFELSAYHARLPKHWHENTDSADPRDFEARLWAAGQVGAATQALELRSGRISRAQNDNDAVWPEFAEFLCGDCHQRLQSSRPTRAGHDRSGSGLPRGAEWNYILADRLLSSTSGRTSNSSLGSGPLLEFNASLEDANAMTDQARGRLLGSTAALKRIRNLDVLTMLVESCTPDASWDTQFQMALALSASERSLRNEILWLTRQQQLRESDIKNLRSAMPATTENLTSIRSQLANSAPMRIPRALRLATTGSIPQVADFDSISLSMRRIADRLIEQQKELRRRFPGD